MTWEIKSICADNIKKKKKKTKGTHVTPRIGFQLNFKCKIRWHGIFTWKKTDVYT